MTKGEQSITLASTILTLVGFLAIGIVLFLLATGCSTTPPPVDVQVKCLPMETYSPTEQSVLADEIAQMSGDSNDYQMTLKALSDYHAMRTTNQACIDSQTGVKTPFKF